jgi:prepilin-type N-terminal cleavage/methylation domain-containing protein
MKALTASLPQESRAHGAAFTLVEIVIVMTILAVLAAASVPTFRGIAREREARAPLVALVALAKETRLRAMKTQRPYQIAFSARGFTASRYIDPYLTLAKLEAYVLEQQQRALESPQPAVTEVSSTGKTTLMASSVNDNAVALADEADAPVAAEWVERQTWPADTQATAQVWHQVDADAALLQGENLVLWVFQPSGICEPLWLTVQHSGATVQVEFGSLTADIIREASSF